MKMQILIEQGNFNSEFNATFSELPTIGQVANILLNEAHSYMAIQKMLVSPKNRPSLAKPFTISIAFESLEGSVIVPDFSTKLTFSEVGQNKLIENTPKILAEMLVSKEIPFSERRNLIKQASNTVLELV